MLDCLALVKDQLPEVASSAISTARNYFSGCAAEEELEEARVRCWKHLDARGYGSEVEEPEAIAIRATICALYARPSTGDDDAGELLEWFLRLLNRLGGRSENVVELLRKHFPASA